MADSRLAQDLYDNFLQCAICLKSHKSPRMLPCLHSFCLQCLEKLQDSLLHQPFSCPTCRREVLVPQNGVKDLPKNFLLVSLMERIHLEKTGKNLPTCHFCEVQGCILLCLNCKLHMCSKCKKFHDMIPDTDGHTVIPVEKLEDETYMKKIHALQIPRCGEHQREYLRFYCTECSKLVCVHCTIVVHRGHNCIEAADRLDASKQILQTALKDSGDSVKSVQKVTDERHAATKRVENQIRDASKTVEGEYQRFLNRLQSDRDTLLRALGKMKEEKRNPLKQKTDNVTDWLAKMENTQTMAKMLLEADNQWEIIEMEKSIAEALKKLTDHGKDFSDEFLATQGQGHNIEVLVPNVYSTRQAASKELPFPPEENMLGEISCHPAFSQIRVNGMIYRRSVKK